MIILVFNLHLQFTKEDKLQDDYIGQKAAEVLAIDYDENQLLAAAFSSLIRKQRRVALSDVK